jgi:hypothetical protein
MKRLFPFLLALTLFATPAFAQAKKKVVFVAGKPSHGFAQHEHAAGCKLLADWINKSTPQLEAVVVNENGWPKDPAVFDGAAAIIMFSDGGNGHMALPYLDQIQALNDKGAGIGAIHYAVEPGDGKKQPDGRKQFLDWIGGYFETFYSVNPHGLGRFTEIGKHPVGNGVKPFATQDEWYYHMRFRDNMEGVTPILTAVPPDSTRKGKDDAHGGNPAVRADLGKNVPEHVMWVSENKNGTRGFGVTGAHFNINWASDNYRKAVLNAIVWTAKVDVPANGVEVPTPKIEELLQNIPKKAPENLDMTAEQKKLDALNKPLEALAK